MKTCRRTLWKIIKKWKKKHDRHRKLKKKFWKQYCKWQKKVFGKECKHHEGKDFIESEFESRDLPAVHHGSGEPVKHRVGRLPGWITEQKGEEMSEEWKDDVVYGLAMGLALNADIETEKALVRSLSMFSGGCKHSQAHLATGHHGHHPHWPGKLIRELIKVVKRLRGINQQLIAFERGFISEAGIPGREWYRHLGAFRSALPPESGLDMVQPPFPALTEAITFEKNETLAQHEVERLKGVMDKLVETVKVKH
ncbi:hypothetical protein MPER_00827 [Moniliophthora perniciosa FA553]|nr:hypothetical protein MPER_00827 [Moniliophthora perniciosa FA553]